MVHPVSVDPVEPNPAKSTERDEHQSDFPGAYGRTSIHRAKPPAFGMDSSVPVDVGFSSNRKPGWRPDACGRKSAVEALTSRGDPARSRPAQGIRGRLQAVWVYWLARPPGAESVRPMSVIEMIR